MAILYYLLLPPLYFIAIQPFWVLYRLSDLLFFFVFYVFRYRQQVVLTNLRNAFPEKTEAEIQKISRDFYRYFCDLLLETIKLLVISRRVLKQRVSFEGEAVFKPYYDRQQSVILILGHLGNWELAGTRFALEPIHTLYAIYRPLKNPFFDRLAYHMRTRLGCKLYTMKGTLRGMISNRKEVTATAFIADQTPSPDNAYWLTFLNQEAPVFAGTERIARKFGYPVIYMSVKRPKRGYYRIEAELLFDDPRQTGEHEITRAHTRRLEEDIRAFPETWLWSHRRWKHKRPEEKP